MAEAIIRLYEDDTLRRSLVDKGKKSAKKYNWEHSVARMAELLELN